MRTVKSRFAGLLAVNIELTDRCNANCWMCGRRKLERDFPSLCNWGNMNFRLVKKIAKEIPPNIFAILHNSGEPTLYPYLSEALSCFYRQIRCFNTNALLLVEKAREIINNMERLTISVIERDPLQDKKYENVRKFLELKGDKKPLMVYRLLGDVGIVDENTIIGSPEYKERIERWYRLPGLVATRVLHNPMGSFCYEKKVTIPEAGICMEVLSRLAINKDGLVSVCTRFDPSKELVIGDVNTTKLWKIWNSHERQRRFVKLHIAGRRSEIPFCNKCDYYGCPTGT